MLNDDQLTALEAVAKAAREAEQRMQAKYFPAGMDAHYYKAVIRRLNVAMTPDVVLALIADIRQLRAANDAAARTIGEMKEQRDALDKLHGLANACLQDARREAVRWETALETERRERGNLAETVKQMGECINNAITAVDNENDGAALYELRIARDMAEAALAAQAGEVGG